MLRKCTDEDISDEECEKVIDPFYENYDSYLEEYVVPKNYFQSSIRSQTLINTGLNQF